MIKRNLTIKSQPKHTKTVQAVFWHWECDCYNLNPKNKKQQKLVVPKRAIKKKPLGAQTVLDTNDCPNGCHSSMVGPYRSMSSSTPTARNVLAWNLRGTLPESLELELHLLSQSEPPSIKFFRDLHSRTALPNKSGGHRCTRSMWTSNKQYYIAVNRTPHEQVQSVSKITASHCYCVSSYRLYNVLSRFLQKGPLNTLNPLQLGGSPQGHLAAAQLHNGGWPGPGRMACRIWSFLIDSLLSSSQKWGTTWHAYKSVSICKPKSRENAKKTDDK